MDVVHSLTLLQEVLPLAPRFFAAAGVTVTVAAAVAVSVSNTVVNSVTGLQDGY